MLSLILSLLRITVAYRSTQSLFLESISLKSPLFLLYLVHLPMAYIDTRIGRRHIYFMTHAMFNQSMVTHHLFRIQFKKERNTHVLRSYRHNINCIFAVTVEI